MLRFSTFYSGHKGAVLALAGNIKDNFFFSVGADGLIVKWALNKPDEGQVITRLNGLIPSIAYDKKASKLYVALNQKGIVVLNSNSGKEEGFISVPSTSFGKISLAIKHLIVSTKKGEFILIEKERNEIVRRYITGLEEAPAYVLDNEDNKLWHYSAEGFDSIDLSLLEKGPERTISVYKGVAYGAIEENFVALVNGKLTFKNIKKSRNSLIEIEVAKELVKLSEGSKAPFLIAISKNNGFYLYKVGKKEIVSFGNVQNEHNGAINDLLWTENHKFVITAGSDKKIGIWRFN